MVIKKKKGPMTLMDFCQKKYGKTFGLDTKKVNREFVANQKLLRQYWAKKTQGKAPSNIGIIF